MMIVAVVPTSVVVVHGLFVRTVDTCLVHHVLVEVVQSIIHQQVVSIAIK